MRTNNNNRGILRIDTGENKLCKVVFQPAGGTVWLRKAELPELFGVNVQTINACLDSICKEKSFDIEKCCKYELYVCGKHVRYDIREVNMEMVIAMTFRIASPNAGILREWFIRRCIHPGLCDIPLSGVGQGFCLN